MTTVPKTIASVNHTLLNGNARFRSLNLFTNGKDSLAKIMASTNATDDNKTASLKNCTDRCHRCAPTDFRTPTSLALSADRAVERFIKFMQAISNTIQAMVKNIAVYFLSNF